MSQQKTETLSFRPASEKLTEELDGRRVILLNPCDGWHVAHIIALEEDGEVYHVGSYQFAGDEFEPHEFYVAWALLADSLSLANNFDDQRLGRRAGENGWRK